MTPEQWEKVSEIYHSASELETADERAAFLDETCAGDEDLRREVESLLAADTEAGDFIAAPVVKDFIPLLVKESDEATLAGKRLAHYQILKRIGVGGMGEVYLARDTKLNRPVAVKTLPLTFSSDENYLRRFEIEAKAAATLNHPNVSTIYSVEEIDDVPFMTMEYVEGKTLDAFIPERGLDLKNFLEWFIVLSDALAHAHEKGIIHRDIKPGNIMITPNGVPKILDFGLAQINRASIAATADEFQLKTLSKKYPEQIFGTPSYMSPEQAEGKTVDERSDIFSFGIVMFEAITGERPFRGDSFASIISEVMTKEPRSITEIKPEIPFLLSRLVMRCLEKDRRKRFHSMREVRVILEEIKAAIDAGVSLNSGSVPHLSAPKPFSRAWILAPLAFLIIALAGFGIYRYAWQTPPAPTLSFENITQRKLSQTNNIIFAQITPDGKSIVYNALDENEGRSLWIRRVEDKNALQLIPSQPVFYWGGLTISEDGSQIYYIIADREGKRRTLYRISSLGGTPRKLVETVNDLGSLSPDGERIIYVRYGEKSMMILSANASDGSDERVIHELDLNYIFRDPQYSLDGESIYFIKFQRIDGEEYWSLVEIPATGGEERVILPQRKPRLSEIVVLKDGSGLLVNAVDAVSNLQQLFHVSVPDGKETRITNDLNTYFGVSISDDCKTIITTLRQNNRDIWVTTDEKKENLRRITTESNVNLTAVFTPDGRIVYDAIDNNRPHIWIMDGDGGNAQQLTPNDSFDYEPRVSPDGRFIVFTSRRGDETKIWRMNIDGTRPQNLTPVVGAAFAPLITPDGQFVLFQWEKEGGRVMGRVPLAGGEISEMPPIHTNTNFYAISQDGKQVARVFYDEAARRFKVRLRPVQSEEPSTVFDISPTSFLKWAADGKGLLYRELDPSRVPGSAVSTVMFQPVPAGEPKQFLSVAPDWITNISQTPDGKRVLVIRDRFQSDAVMMTKITSD